MKGPFILIGGMRRINLFICVVRGECKGWAHSGWRGNTCVEDIEYTYRYYIPSIEEFIPANKGLSIWCKS